MPLISVAKGNLLWGLGFTVSGF